MTGTDVTLGRADNCYGCGDRLEAETDAFMGEDGNIYGLDCCADLTTQEIAANAQEWADFNGVSYNVDGVHQRYVPGVGWTWG